jgi:hypothetical protein
MLHRHAQRSASPLIAAQLDAKYAILVSAEARNDQQDKLENPCFDHCRRVTNAVSGDEERIVAYRNDVPEKASAWTLDRLNEEGFRKLSSPRLMR